MINITNWPNPVQWQHPDSRTLLDKADKKTIHVWQIQLSDPGWQQRQRLADDEAIRADRIRGDLQRLRFISSRVALRTIVSSYLDCPPGALGFKTAKKGKPRLTMPEMNLEFNLTHSANLALLAVAYRPVGVDVERHRSTPHLLEIARRVFPEEDFESLINTGQDQQSAHFFALWTQFEARQKARGLGVFDSHKAIQSCGILAFTAEAHHPAAIAWIKADDEGQQPDIRFFLALPD